MLWNTEEVTHTKTLVNVCDQLWIDPFQVAVMEKLPVGCRIIFNSGSHITTELSLESVRDALYPPEQGE